MAGDTSIPFPFFGAGDATYYEEASLIVAFHDAPSRALRKQLEEGIPAPLEAERWTQRTLLLATDAHALVGWTSFDKLNAAIERWLHACHAIAPIDFALRAEDSEAGTTFSSWHTESMAGALALVLHLAKRYDDDETRPFVKETLLEMMRGAGIAIPAKLDPSATWRAALDAGDAKTFGPLLAHNAEDIQLVLDRKNANHRRAVLGSRPKLEQRGPLDVRIFELAVMEDSADARYVVDRFVERAAKEPFWSTTCASAAAECVTDAPESALGILDRLVELGNAHAIVVENALWAVEKLGYRSVSRERLDRYWAIAVEKLPSWPQLRPYLEQLASVLEREVPAPVAAKPPKGSRTRRS